VMSMNVMKVQIIVTLTQPVTTESVVIFVFVSTDFMETEQIVWM